MDKLERMAMDGTATPNDLWELFWLRWEGRP